MYTLFCRQRGCHLPDAVPEVPAECPVCNNPLIAGDETHIGDNPPPIIPPLPDTAVVIEGGPRPVIEDDEVSPAKLGHGATDPGDGFPPLPEV